MITKLQKFINNKRVLVLGFGKEGQSTYRVLKQLDNYCRLDIADRYLTDTGAVGGQRLFTGADYLDCMDGYDIVFKSPGIVLPKKPEGYSCALTSQTDIFLDAYGRQTVGITGTKGKSTVSSLIGHVLRAGGLDCVLAGNIGIPVFDVLDRISPETAVVLELSCHQLEYCGHSPHIAALLNIFEDHLDYYKSVKNYIAAKSNIYKYQSASDILFYKPDCAAYVAGHPSRAVPVSVSDLPFADPGFKLPGEHNLLNCAFAYGVCGLFDVKDEDFRAALRSYRPLPHRLEYIGNKSGVDYYDDSISTTAESTISAVKSIPNAKVVLIGGMDRGIDYSALAAFLAQSSLSHIILMYESGRRIYGMLQGLTMGGAAPVLVPDLQTAAEAARKYAAPGSACILSPASASYGDFRNFEERGDLFRALIFES
jgi:UDP-N-acetylmuramoylalanine--D-glutamate ligase